MVSALPVDINPFTEQTPGRFFVGREEQLQRFERALKGLQDGNPGHLFVAGIHGTGKTSYLAKLVELAKEQGFLATLPTLDPAATGRQHVVTIVRSLIEALEDEMSTAAKKKVKTLALDWEKGGGATKFRLPLNERLVSDDVRADLRTIQELAAELGKSRVVVCIDEGQRIDPFALSALKNSLQQLSDYLIVLSLRLIDETTDTVDAGRTILDTKAAEAENDYGASRFFLTGIPLGPFDTDHESRECLNKRLEGNAVAFDDDVVTLVARVTGRHPAKIISLAHHIYDLAAETTSQRADLGLFRKCFAVYHRKTYVEAAELVGSHSETTKQTLSALLKFDRPANSLEIAGEIYPGTISDKLSIAAAGVTSELNQLEILTSFVQRVEERYVVADPVRRYALATILGVS